MKIYRLSEDRSPDAGSFSGGLEGTYKWSLPAYQCPSCSLRRVPFSIAFPSVDLSAVPGDLRKDLEALTGGTRKDYERCMSAVVPMLPDVRLRIVTSAQFGPWVGKGRGKFGSLAWPVSQSPLVRQEVAEQLLTSGLNLRFGPADVKVTPPKNAPGFVALEAWPLAKYSNTAFPGSIEPPACSTCRYYVGPISRSRWGEPDDILIRSSIPTDQDAFCEERYGAVYVSERFTKVAAELKLTMYSVKAVELLDE